MQRSDGDGGEVLVVDAHPEAGAGGHRERPAARAAAARAATGESKSPSVASPQASVSSSAAASWSAAAMPQGPSSVLDRKAPSP